MLAKAPDTKDQIASWRKRSKIIQSRLLSLISWRNSTKLQGVRRNLLACWPSFQGNSRAATLANINSRLNSYRQTRSTESVQGYLELFEKNPELIEREYPYFQMSASQKQRLGYGRANALGWPVEKTIEPQFDNHVVDGHLAGNEFVGGQLLKRMLEAEDFLPRFADAFRAMVRRTEMERRNRNCDRPTGAQIAQRSPTTLAAGEQ